MSDTNPFDPSNLRPYRPEKGESGDAASSPASPPQAPPTQGAITGESSLDVVDDRRTWPDDIPVTGGEAVWPILAVWAVMIITYGILSQVLLHDHFMFLRPLITLVKKMLIVGLLYYLLYVRHAEGLVDGLHLRLGRIPWIVAGALFGGAYYVGMYYLLDRPLVGGQGGDSVRMLSATVVSLVAAFVDELFYRGLIYPLVRRGVGVLLAVVIVTLWFGLVWGGTGTEGQLINQWWLGSMLGLSLVLTLARVFSRNVGLPIAIHMGFSVALCVVMWLNFAGGK